MRTLAGEKALERPQDKLEDWCNLYITLAEQLLERAYDFFDVYQHVFP
jgi:hypothetical protein